MKNLSITEKYRPQTLGQIRGNEMIVRMLKSFVKNPVSKAFLLSGPPGCGKTSAAYAIARELGCDFECGGPKECGGIFEIASGEMTADTVREMFKTTLAYRPFYGSGWKVVIANEADKMSAKASEIWLDVLEHLPAKTVVVFSTNDVRGLESRFRQRCECHAFKTPVRGFDQPESAAEIAAQGLIDDVWQSELGHNHSPRLADLDGWNDGGHISFRSVLSALDPLIRAQREIDIEQAETEKQKAAEIKFPEILPSGRVSALAEMEKARAFFATV